MYKSSKKDGIHLIGNSGLALDIYSGFGIRYRKINTITDASNEVLADHPKLPDSFFPSVLLGFQRGLALL